MHPTTKACTQFDLTFAAFSAKAMTIVFLNQIPSCSNVHECIFCMLQVLPKCIPTCPLHILRQGIPKGAAAQRLVLDACDPISIVSIRYLYHCKSLFEVIMSLHREYHLHYEYHFTGNYQLFST